MDPKAELLALLAEAPEVVGVRARTLFDEQALGRRVVLVGAGGLGMRAASAMVGAGMPAPIAIADNAVERWRDRSRGQLPIYPIADAVALHRDAVFVVTIWGAGRTHRIRDTEQQLQALGVQTIPFAHLLWKCNAGPHYWLDTPEKVLADRAGVLATFDLLADDESRRVYVANIRARITGRFDALPEPMAGPAYVPGHVYAAHPQEKIVDGGAFDGDTLRAWMNHGRLFSHWTAIEPHPVNAHAFRRNLQALPADVQRRVTLYELAADGTSGTLRMPRLGGESAATLVAGTDLVAVDAAPLDHLAFAADATLIKLDIEGAEPQALVGARQIVAARAPVLAVCVYHKQHHLWTLPRAMQAMRDDYAIYLRPHGAEGWDLVCYAVPAARRLHAEAA